MHAPRRNSTHGWRPRAAVLAGCYLLATAGCMEGWDYPSTTKIDPSIFEPGDPNRVQVKHARLRSAPGGCEVDVTFTNVSDRSLSAGFRYDILDAAGRIMLLMTHNTDIGDSWEREGDDPDYFYTFSVHGYAFGINVLVHAMTH